MSKHKLKLTSALQCITLTPKRILSTSTSPQNQDSKEVVLENLSDQYDGIATIGLNRPAARNSFGEILVSQLMDAISAAQQSEKVRVLIVRSLVPRVFCAGADLRERFKMEGVEVLKFGYKLRALMSSLESFPAPVISAIDGFALGGGLEMALATDIRVAASEAKMGLVETKLAIMPGAGGTQRLPRLVGPGLAKELIFTARVIDGREAYRIGLINRVVPQNKSEDAAYQQALTIGREILSCGPIGVRLAKEAIDEGLEKPLQKGIEIERQCYVKLIDSEDRLEGLKAFVEKRAPVYRGR